MDGSIRGTFATTAARVAYVITAHDRGHLFKDNEDGGYFLAINRGASADHWVKLSSLLHDWKTFDLDRFRLVSSGGDPGAIAAIGGHLGSDTVPILRGDANEGFEIHWAAASAAIVSQSRTLHGNFDGSRDVLVQAYVRTDNAGGGGVEAASFSLLTSWDNGAQVTDTLTDASPSVDAHVVEATIAAADIPNAPFNLTLQLVPGTHANDPIQLLGLRLRHFIR